MVKKLLLMDSAIYLNLSKERLYSNSFIPSKDVAKVTQIPTESVFEFDEDEIPNIKISFFGGKLNNLITLDQNELFKIYSDDKGVHIAGDTYDIVVDDSGESNHPEINLFKSFFSRIDKESYEISVCQNKLVMDSVDSSTKIALNLAIKA